MANATETRVSVPTASEGIAFSDTGVFHFTDAAGASADPADYKATVYTGDATLDSAANPDNVKIVASHPGLDVGL